MGEFDKVDVFPRKVMVLFLIADTSSSMAGEKISSLNVAVRDVIPTISDMSSSNSDAQIKIAAMEFSSGTEWMYPQPIEAENFQWRDLEAGGLTCLGEACDELCSKLSKKAFMTSASGSFAPAVILLSDGEPTDDYKHGLEKLKENPWFKNGIKVAIAIGDDANQDILAEFTGSKESVLTVHNKEQLKKLIHYVVVTSSQVASTSSSIGKDAPATKQDEINAKIKTEIESNPVMDGVDIGVDVTPDSGAGWDNNDWG